MENEKWYHHRLLRRSDLFWVTFCFCCWMGGIWIHSTPTRLLSPTTKLNDLHFCRVSHQSSQQQKEKLDISWRRKRFEKTEKWCCSKSSLVTSVTRLGDFFKLLGNKCFHKKEPKYLVTFGAILKYTTLKVKTALATFWATFGKMGLHWILKSGHTARNDAFSARTKNERWIDTQRIRFEQMYLKWDKTSIRCDGGPVVPCLTHVREVASSSADYLFHAKISKTERDEVKGHLVLCWH